MEPIARHDDVIVEELLDEVMVYDRKRAKAHCLNRTAAFVWRQCDGQTSAADLARRLHQELGVPPDEELVWLALDRLEKAHLLEQPLGREPGGPGISRREVMRKLKLAGGLSLLLPVVTSIVAPAPAMAASGTLASGKLGCGQGPCYATIVGTNCAEGTFCFFTNGQNLCCGPGSNGTQCNC